ncbi:diguanylate cyclase [Roseibium aquae]|uniref:Diguanylate cyclase n=1 Tax=Roseibium aquae TaxID=1323746 RepID=A0A916TGT4_9HYPH|nr:EAL domain-containing protein [Roseibium aquae]GGB44098.1 diguanylate cyclase [Roseibium aquae]
MLKSAADAKDIVLFVDETDRTPPSQLFWNVLIVDDDPDVHEATRLALDNVKIEGRPLRFLHARSEAEAMDILHSAKDTIPVALIDVVMERSDSGLRLVKHIRDELGLDTLQIILRTGQPGYAPELETIETYNINDYRTKSNLTRTRLCTSLIVAIRSYNQLRHLETNKRGFEKIVSASTHLNGLRSLSQFADGVIAQICALLEVPENGFTTVVGVDGALVDPLVISGTGRFEGYAGQNLADLKNDVIREQIEICIRNKANQLGPLTCFVFRASNDVCLATCVDTPRCDHEIDHRVIEAFCASVTVGFENVLLNGKLQRLAYRDHLTDLPNRNGFERIIDDYLANETDGRLALVDIDDFASINAALDQHYGDDVLRAIAGRLLDVLGRSVSLGRISGDCFGVIGPEDAVRPDMIDDLFTEPIVVNNEPLRLSATSGFVSLRQSSGSGMQLLKDANIALKQAKLENRGKALVFSENLRTQADARINMLSGLRSAFTSQRLFLAYQPQVTMSDGRLVGLEALLRWRDAHGSFIPPDQFIPLAEKSGLINPIGDWVLRVACDQLRAFLDAGHHQTRMAVNVSHVQFREPGFVETVAEVLSETGVPAKYLEIELTESVAVENTDMIVSRLQDLRSLGVSIALDDFGTGYSSLSVLKDLPLDKLKIDRSFIRDLHSHETATNVADLIVAFGKKMGLELIAEGVETPDQIEILRSMGCEVAQGFYYSRPLEAAQLFKWLEARQEDAT